QVPLACADAAVLLVDRPRPSGITGRRAESGDRARKARRVGRDNRDPSAAAPAARLTAPAACAAVGINDAGAAHRSRRDVDRAAPAAAPAAAGAAARAAGAAVGALGGERAV